MMFRINLINHKTLPLALTLALLLTWALSLRPVRLFIGDYYFSKGNFDKSVNWYNKVTRKSKLCIDHDRGNRLKYEEDLFKLNISLILGMEGILLKINQALGFTEIKDLKFLLNESTLFLKKIKELVGTGPKEQLLKMKEELEYFNNLTTMFKSYGKRSPKAKNWRILSLWVFP